MVNYKDLGLVNTREMFAKAIKGGYAIPAFNFNNMEQMQAIIKAAVEIPARSRPAPVPCNPASSGQSQPAWAVPASYTGLG